MCFSLKEEREEDEGASRSPLGAKQGTLRECFGLRWTKKTATSVGRVETYCRHSLRVSYFIVIAMCFPLKRERGPKGGINISSGSGTGGFEGLLRIEVGQEDS